MKWIVIIILLLFYIYLDCTFKELDAFETSVKFLIFISDKSLQYIGSCYFLSFSLLFSPHSFSLLIPSLSFVTFLYFSLSFLSLLSSSFSLRLCLLPHYIAPPALLLTNIVFHLINILLFYQKQCIKKICKHWPVTSPLIISSTSILLRSPSLRRRVFVTSYPPGY